MNKAIIIMQSIIILMTIGSLIYAFLIHNKRVVKKDENLCSDEDDITYEINHSIGIMFYRNNKFYGYHADVVSYTDYPKKNIILCNKSSGDQFITDMKGDIIIGDFSEIWVPDDNSEFIYVVNKETGTKGYIDIRNYDVIASSKLTPDNIDTILLTVKNLAVDVQEILKRTEFCLDVLYRDGEILGCYLFSNKSNPIFIRSVEHVQNIKLPSGTEDMKVILYTILGSFSTTLRRIHNDKEAQVVNN